MVQGRDRRRKEVIYRLSNDEKNFDLGWTLKVEGQGQTWNELSNDEKLFDLMLLLLEIIKCQGTVRFEVKYLNNGIR